MFVYGSFLLRMGPCGQECGSFVGLGFCWRTNATPMPDLLNTAFETDAVCNIVISSNMLCESPPHTCQYYRDPNRIHPYPTPRGCLWWCLWFHELTPKTSDKDDRSRSADRHASLDWGQTPWSRQVDCSNPSISWFHDISILRVFSQLSAIIWLYASIRVRRVSRQPDHLGSSSLFSGVPVVPGVDL